MPLQPVKFEEKDLARFFKNPAKVRFNRFARRAVSNLAWLTFFFIISIALINSPAYYKRVQYAWAGPSLEPSLTTVNPTPKPEPTPEPEPEPVRYDPKITVEKINLDAPIIWQVDSPEIISQLANGVVHYKNSALPGQIGNVVLVGHSSDLPWRPGGYKTVFALLDRLTAGDQIKIAYETNIYTYTLVESKVVKPSNVEVILPTDQPTLTLITCFPVGTVRSRLVLSAKLTEGPVGSTQETSPITTVLPKIR